MSGSSQRIHARQIAGPVCDSATVPDESAPEPPDQDDPPGAAAEFTGMALTDQSATEDAVSVTAAVRASPAGSGSASGTLSAVASQAGQRVGSTSDTITQSVPRELYQITVPVTPRSGFEEAGVSVAVELTEDGSLVSRETTQVSLPVGSEPPGDGGNDQPPGDGGGGGNGGNDQPPGDGGGGGNGGNDQPPGDGGGGGNGGNGGDGQPPADDSTGLSREAILAGAAAIGGYLLTQ